MPTSLTQQRSAFYHTANRSLTRADQEIFNTTLNSTGITKAVSELYRDVLPFVNTKEEIDTWLTSNPGYLLKHDKVALTELVGSNGQTWYIEHNGERVTTFITEQFLVDLGNNTVPNGYVFELYEQDGTRIPPATYDWWVKPDEGLIRFEAGSTPADLGIGVPSATVYSGIIQVTSGSSVGEPIFVGEEGVDGSWMIIRDFDDNLDSYNTDITKLNDDRLHFFRFENGTYKSKSQMGESIHSDKFIINDESGGVYLPYDEGLVRVIRQGNRGGDFFVAGNYYNRTALATNDKDNLYHVYVEKELIEVSRLGGKESEWGYTPESDFYEFILPAAPTTRAYYDYALFSKDAGVRFRYLASYVDTGQKLFENVSEYEFSIGLGHVTTEDVTHLTFNNDPLPVNADREVRLQLWLSQPMGFRIYPQGTTTDEQLHREYSYKLIQVNKVNSYPYWLPSMAGTTVKVGTEFYDYDGIICTKEHIGVYPLDIFDGNWKRKGDDRQFIFRGTEAEKLTRLDCSYVPLGFIKVPWGRHHDMFVTSQASFYKGVKNAFFSSHEQNIGSADKGWESAQLTDPIGDSIQQRLWVGLNHAYVIEKVRISNFHDAGNDVGKGVQFIRIYGTNTTPSNTFKNIEGMDFLYGGVVAVHSEEDKEEFFDIEIDNKLSHKFIVIDVYSNWGDTDSVGVREITFWTGGNTAYLEAPDQEYKLIQPVWGDNGNLQGTVIQRELGESDPEHGPTEWAEAEMHNTNTLHDSNGLCLSSNGENILFSPGTPVGKSEWATADALNLPSLHDSTTLLALGDLVSGQFLTFDAYLQTATPGSGLQFYLDDTIGNLGSPFHPVEIVHNGSYIVRDLGGAQRNAWFKVDSNKVQSFSITSSNLNEGIGEIITLNFVFSLEVAQEFGNLLGVLAVTRDDVYRMHFNLVSRNINGIVGSDSWAVIYEFADGTQATPGTNGVFHVPNMATP